MKIKLSIFWSLQQAIWLAGLAFSVPSCSKSNQTITDSTCITREVPKAIDYQVSDSDLQLIYALFKANNLSTANLQFLSYLTYYDAGIASGYPGSPGYIGPAEEVNATPFFNGLPAWVGGEFFIFNAGIYQPGGMNDGYTGPLPNANITTRQTLSDLRHDFLAHVTESGTVGGAANSRGNFPFTLSSYADSCLVVTLGYMDASMIPGSTTPPQTALIKVWSVTALHGGLPAVNVEDDNGLAWGVVFDVP